MAGEAFFFSLFAFILENTFTFVVWMQLFLSKSEKKMLQYQQCVNHMSAFFFFYHSDAELAAQITFTIRITKAQTRTHQRSWAGEPPAPCAHLVADDRDLPWTSARPRPTSRCIQKN